MVIVLLWIKFKMNSNKEPKQFKKQLMNKDYKKNQNKKRDNKCNNNNKTECSLLDKVDSDQEKHQ